MVLRKRNEKVRQIIFLIIISAFLTGVSSCEQKPDAFKCITVKDENHNIYLRCRNSHTKESVNKSLDEIGKCIRNPLDECAWIMTDEREYKIILETINEDEKK